MLILILGYNTPSRHETPEVLYIGHDGDDAQAAIELAEHPRVERLDDAHARTVRTYAAPVEPIKK